MEIKGSFILKKSRPFILKKSRPFLFIFAIPYAKPCSLTFPSRCSYQICLGYSAYKCLWFKKGISLNSIRPIPNKQTKRQAELYKWVIRSKLIRKSLFNDDRTIEIQFSYERCAQHHEKFVQLPYA